ncbi:MAG: glycosyl transferase family 2 [Clostridiales bacterium]|jgi:glycosyltransferase involved in cell wall biosynthesis|nr:glycosyl transferase family 2 [Clostridiales bacterium]
MRYKVVVYAICKNEATLVDAWMRSMGEADKIVIMDTGSNDGTAEALRKNGAAVTVREVKPWRFDTARNLSLDLVPQDADICVCTDLDESFEKGWREKLEKAWQPDTQRARYIYNWSLKPDGSPDTQLVYFKIHARRGYAWRYPIHEYLEYVGEPPEKEIFIEDLVLNHYPDYSKPRSGYLPMLEAAVREEPENERFAYYLGREYMFMGLWTQCVDTLKRQLSLASSQWKEERCACMRWIARSYSGLGRREDARAWLYKAIAECSSMREPYIEMALLAYEEQDWQSVFYFARQALKIREKSQCFVNMGYAWDHTPDDMAALGCYYLGMTEQALKHAKNALALAPGDERLQNNVRWIKTAMEKKFMEKRL